jgi:tetratricopeptide (TPR) repeat protein
MASALLDQVRQHLRATLFALLALSWAAPAAAQLQATDPFDVKRVSAVEWARLPEYCPHTQTYHQGGPAYDNWIARLGFTFSALHHYCWAIIKANRAMALGVEPHVRRALLNSAIEECFYVLRHAAPDFVLLPEIYLRLGQFAAGLEDHARALEFFEKSIGTKVDYWPPYVEIANVNLSIRRRQHAIDALHRGLRVMPGQQQLTTALTRIESDASLGRTKGAAASQP